ncbi:hypothetical protein LSAT2_005734 [Lamellibrachia satsuma]|nr:hypothetical protein LSAT2_005734 [Lamellibrachia satsuma]
MCLKPDCSAIMSKLLVALMMLSIAYAQRGIWCSLDKCKSKDKGVKYQSFCGPSHLFYVCWNDGARYSWCSLPEFCVIHGSCRRCGDSCENKPDGEYPSLDRARPYYYSCESGKLSYRECEPFQIFNPWIKRCAVTQHSAGDVALSSTFTGAANCNRRDTCLSPRNVPNSRNHLRMSMAALKRNTEEKVYGGELSVGSDTVRTSCNASRLGKELGVSRELGNIYTLKRLQLRRADYLSKEELVLRFLRE